MAMTQLSWSENMKNAFLQRLLVGAGYDWLELYVVINRARWERKCKDNWMRQSFKKNIVIVTSSAVNLITYIQLWLSRHKDYKQTYVHMWEGERDDINNYKLSFTHIFHILYAKHGGRRTRKLMLSAEL